MKSSSACWPTTKPDEFSGQGMRLSAIACGCSSVACSKSFLSVFMVSVFLVDTRLLVSGPGLFQSFVGNGQTSALPILRVISLSGDYCLKGGAWMGATVATC